MGEAGVTECLEIIHKELDITMAFCGHTDIRQVDRSILLPPRSQVLASSPYGSSERPRTEPTAPQISKDPLSMNDNGNRSGHVTESRA